METDASNVNAVLFSNHPFDISHGRRKQKYKNVFKLSKPKEVTKGAKGIRQYMTVDETKLTMEQQFGKNISLEECSL